MGHQFSLGRGAKGFAQVPKEDAVKLENKQEKPGWKLESSEPGDDHEHYVFYDEKGEEKDWKPLRAEC